MIIEPGTPMSKPMSDPSDAANSARFNDLQSQLDWLRTSIPPPWTDEDIGAVARRAVPPRDIFSYRFARPDDLDRMYVAGQLTAGAFGSLGVYAVADTIYALPFHLPLGMAVYQVHVRLNAAPGASRSVRFAIYASAKGQMYPERLVWASQTYVIDGLWIVTITANPNRRPQGDRLYWLCYMANDNINVVRPSPDSMWGSIGVPTSSFKTSQYQQVGWTASNTFSNGYPNVFPTGATALYTNDDFPALGVTFKGALP